jgi:hypothetical protein
MMKSRTDNTRHEARKAGSLLLWEREAPITPQGYLPGWAHRNTPLHRRPWGRAEAQNPPTLVLIPRDPSPRSSFEGTASRAPTATQAPDFAVHCLPGRPGQVSNLATAQAAGRAERRNSMRSSPEVPLCHRGTSGASASALVRVTSQCVPTPLPIGACRGAQPLCVSSHTPRVGARGL